MANRSSIGGQRHDRARRLRRMRGEARMLRALLSDFSGTLVVQIGAPEPDWLPAGRYTDLIKLGDETCGVAARSRAEALPIADASADLVLLIHVLRHSPAPAAIVAEAARVLRGEGRLVVVERQPWAVPREWPAILAGRGRIPGCRKLRGLIADAGLEWRGGAGFSARPNGRRARATCRRLGYTSQAALAVKRVAGMTVLRPAWSDRRERRRGVLQEHGHAG